VIKKIASAKDRPAPEKLVCDMTPEELDASVKEKVQKFFESCKKSPEKPYFHLPPKQLRKMVDERTKKSREDDRPKPQE
jgi:hypothetical protein